MSRNVYFSVVTIVLLFLYFCFFFRYGFNGLPFTDLYGQSRICTYVLNGLDPYEYVGSLVEPIAGLGKIPTGWGTSPWGLLLGNLFYPGVRSFACVKVFFICTNCVVIVLTSWYMAKRAEERSEVFSTIVFLMFVLSPYYWCSLREGNAGGMICCLSIIGLMISEKNPVISGLLISFATVKPQIVIPFCIVMMLRSIWKPLFVCLIVDLVAVFIASVLVEKSASNLVLEFLITNIGDNRNYAGIFTLLSFWTENHRLSLLVSMAFGLSLTILTSWYLREAELWYSLVVACTVSTLWCYSWSNDFFVLIIPSAVYFWNSIACKNKLNKTIWFLFGLYCYFGFSVMSRISALLSKFYNLPSPSALFNVWLSRTLYEIGLLVICYIFVFSRCIENRRCE